MEFLLIVWRSCSRVCVRVLHENDCDPGAVTKNGTFREVGEPHRWDFSTGAGVRPEARPAEKQQLVLAVLVDELAATDAFWEAVETVAAAQSGSRGALAESKAGLYGNGTRRRAVIADLLLRAAQKPGARTVESDASQEWLRQPAVQRMLRRAFYTPAEPARERGHYRYRPAFQKMIRKGAHRIALRGAGKCWECECVLRRKHRDYCELHRASITPYKKEQNAHDVAMVFNYAAKAIQAS